MPTGSSRQNVFSDGSFAISSGVKTSCRFDIGSSVASASPGGISVVTVASLMRFTETVESLSPIRIMDWDTRSPCRVLTTSSGSTRPTICVLGPPAWPGPRLTLS